MGRLEAEQDPGPARLKQSQNPAAPAESPINTDSLIKIAPEAEAAPAPVQFQGCLQLHSGVVAA